MACTEKALSVSFSYAQGKFSGGGNSAAITGLAMSARITTPGSDDAGNLELSIFGLPLSMMNQLTVLPTASTAIGQNIVTVMAGDAPNPTEVVFTGTVNLAYTDATAQPNVCFRVFAIAGLVEKTKPVPAISAPGTSDVATVMGQIAQAPAGNSITAALTSSFKASTCRARRFSRPHRSPVTPE